MSDGASFDPASPIIVGLGGSVREGSSTEFALEAGLAAARQAGARTVLVGARVLSELPLYGLVGAPHSDAALQFLAALRSCDGLIIASPAYHGAVSGAVKNAIDYIEETRNDARPYLDGLPVGLIVTAGGWQAAGPALGSLRAIVHALRGWPTPMGAAVNTSLSRFEAGVCQDAAAASQLALVGRQVVDFADNRRLGSSISG